MSQESAYPERIGTGVTTAEAAAGVLWACAQSTVKRVLRGEGALLAVNLSLIVAGGASLALGGMQAFVSTLTIAVMYAFNDFYDAPVDWTNPRKDRRLIATYLEQRFACGMTILLLSMGTITLAFASLGTRAGFATAGVMVINVLYSRILKGVPVLDVVWCGLWGAAYAAIVSSSGPLLVLVALMTAVCHLYQAIGDRAPDAANHIMTTAVRSSALAAGVLLVLSVLLLAVLREPLGTPSATTAFIPFALMFVAAPQTGWLLSKLYFGAVWLHVLMFANALG